MNNGSDEGWLCLIKYWLREVECQHARGPKYPFVQEFEFVPMK